FSLYRSFISLVKLIPKYFILFDAIVNEIAFVISFSDHSLSVYRNAIAFHVLTLYPATLRNSFVISNSFFVKYLWFFTYKIISSENRDNFTSSFPIWMPFLFLV
uniref:Uncharacterized protein n=1 Tax=Equus caballus TaxID=9796 RepID=A0A9L0RQC9_HORSE